MTHSGLNSPTSYINPDIPFLGAYVQPQGGPSYPIPTTSPQSHARSSNTYDRRYGVPLAPYPNNATLESLDIHGSHSQGYGDPVSHESAAVPLHPKQQPQPPVCIRGRVPPSFTSGNMAAPTTHANGVAGTPNYARPLSSPVYALQPHASLTPVLLPTNSFSTSITASPSLTVPPFVDTPNRASGDGRGRNLQLSTSSASLLLQKGLETDGGPSLPPPAASCSPLRKLRCKPRKAMDDVSFERDIPKLQQRLRGQGGDEDAIARVPNVFKNGVSKNALKLRRRKANGGGSMNFDQGYMNFVGRRQVKKENGMEEYYENEWWCRLCPPEDRKPYAAFKNLQPHMCSKHFGLPGRGKSSGVSPYNTCDRPADCLPNPEHVAQIYVEVADHGHHNHGQKAQYIFRGL